MTENELRKDAVIKQLQLAIRNAGYGTGGTFDNTLVVNALIELAAMITAGDAAVEEATQEIVSTFPQIVAAYRTH
jgi:hypothetical protein